MVRFRTMLCAAVAASGLALGTQAPAQSTITINLPAGVTCSGDGTTINCTSGSGGPPPTTLSSCSVSPSSASITAGSSQTFTANCNVTPDSYVWDSGGAASCGNAKTCMLPGSATVAGASGTMVVTATKGSDTVSASASWTVSSGSGGGTIPATCTDGTKSVVAPTIQNFDGRRLTAKLKAGQTLVVPIVIPSGGNVKVTGYEWGDNVDGMKRDWWMSKTPCYADPNTGSSSGQYQDRMVSEKTSQATIPFVVGASSYIDMGRGGVFSVYARPGETWYLMVQDVGSTGCSTYGSTGCTVALDANPN